MSSRPVSLWGRPPHLATEDDLRLCYRLFLGRDPDPGGWEFWMGSISSGGVSLRDLIQSFMQGREFRFGRGTANEPLPIVVDGITLFVEPHNPVVGHEVAIHGTYEPGLTAAVRPFLRPGAVLLDVGANIGYYSMLAASLVGPSGRVIAVEPGPRSCELLRLSVEANGFKNVEIHACAASDRERFFEVQPFGIMGAIRVHEVPASGATSDKDLLRGRPLDEVLGPLDRLDVLKIDIDGGEPRAFLGMERLVRRLRPVIFTEFSPDLLREISAIEPVDYLRQLAGYGYEFLAIEPDPETPADLLLPEQVIALHARRTEFLGRPAHIDLMARPTAA